MFFTPPRSGRGLHRSGSFCRRPRKGPAVSGASLSDGAAGLSWHANISMPIPGLRSFVAEHQAFYRRVFLHETIAEPRPFPNALAKVALMASDFRAVREKVLDRFPIMRSSAFERRMLFSAAVSVARFERHRDLDLRACLDRSEFLTAASPELAGRAVGRQVSAKSARNSPFGPGSSAQSGRFRPRLPLAFTLAPHLQLINYRGCFSPFVGI